MPFQKEGHLAGPHIPHIARMTAAGNHQQRPVWAEDHMIDLSAQVGDFGVKRAAGHVPQTRHRPGAAAGQQATVGAEGEIIQAL